MTVEEVLITGCSSEMQGVGRLSDSRAVFVPFALPNERARIEIIENRDRFARARLVSVEEPSPDRARPFCAHYGVCGGCHTQHMTYEAALIYKRRKVSDALSRIGSVKDPNVEPTVPSENRINYRNKAEFAFSETACGMREGGGREIVDIDFCPLQKPELNAAFQLVRSERGNLPIAGMVARANAKGEIQITLCVTSPADINKLARTLDARLPRVSAVYRCALKPRPTHALDGEISTALKNFEFYETVNGLTLGASPDAFFQVNPRQAEKLYDLALRFASVEPGARLTDIYSGAGAIALLAAQSGARATGIEIVPAAVANALANARINSLSDRADFICADASAAYPRLARVSPADCVTLDPPRRGVDSKVLDSLIKSPAKNVVYVSCDPATLARDIKTLEASGIYAFQKAVPIDMFPQTHHIETVALLSGVL